MEYIVILLLALIVDLTLGELPSPFHPVAWLGKLIQLEVKIAPRQGKWARLLCGTLMVLGTVALLALPSYFLLAYLAGVNQIVYILVAAILLKVTFSIKGLRKAALSVKRALEAKNLMGARREVKSLVSRDATKLGEPHLVSATVESVAENLSDSFVAPLFYFIIFGVPGAIAYRVVNTFDAMIGYHGEYEYLGKFAARLDDGLNFIPARISGVLLVLASYLLKKDGRRAWQVMFRDHGKTPSPNAGWPMSAVAGALEVRLEKIGYYRLGDKGSPLSPGLISSGIRLVYSACLFWVLFCLAVEVMRFVYTA